ncbi:PKD domain-containing protein [Leifsonia sp. LS-T14]|uniref:PKD domain-containing protein n=1 Tax=unclassified Leifsonia TaxID=2663824 RepID=UPI0035A61906
MRTRILAATVAAATIAASFFVGTQAAVADTAPPDAATPKTVSTDPLPTVQINGVVWTQLVVGNTVYVGGNFSTAQPAGAAAGVNTVSRTSILAYNLQTGVLSTTFAPVLNGVVRSIAASPDGSRIYIGGNFTTVNGVNKYRVAALNPTTGAVIGQFGADTNAQVYAVAANATTVYIGGVFSTVNGATHNKIAAVNATTGVTNAWAPGADDGTVTSLVVSPDGSKVVAGGNFTSFNGSNNPGYGLAAVDTTTGASVPWKVNGLIRNGGTQASITSLSSDGDSVYGSGYVFGSTGNLEGVFRASWADGTMNWVEDCHGDTYSAAPYQGAVYAAGHPHYCGNIGGFPQTSPTWTFHRGLAFSKDATGTATADPYGYYNYAGKPTPTLLNWFPDFNVGTFTGESQGPWSVAAGGNYVLYGGEFTTVNGTRQQGLVRFAVPAIAPNKDGPQLSGSNYKPNVASFTSGTARISWPANWDRDNVTLKYELLRDGNNTHPVYTQTVNSTFWNRPNMGFVDTGLAPGSTHGYRLRVTDPFGNQVLGDGVNVTVASSGTMSPYATDVLNDGASSYYRMGESAGPNVYDWSGFSDATASNVTFGAPGAIIGDSNTAGSFNGSNSLVATTTPIAGPNTFALEAWFNTTSTSGGKIVGFGDKNTGNSSNYDRHIYMDGSGRVYFGVYPGSSQTVQSAPGLNDGKWHQVVAQLSPGGMQLYIDDVLVGNRTDVTTAQPYSGYWRIGGDSPWTGNAYFAGSIDDVSIYSQPLTRTQVDTHWVASGRTSVIPTAPADSYGNRVFNDAPSSYWRLNETSGSTAKDSSAGLQPGIYSGGVTKNVPGVISGNSAAQFDGSSGLVSSAQQVSNPTTYSLELWFNTTTHSGGKLIGFGSSQTGLSSSYDRHVYMQDDGRLVFGVWTGQTNTITTTNPYNDGQWHHVVATQGSGGMVLYVDGQQQGTNPQTAAQGYDGYWRVGGDNTWGSSSPYINATIDEAAVYPAVLSASTVKQHYVLGGGQVPNTPPTASFTNTVTNQDVSVDGSASADSDGTIASYAWNFGDGGTATGATATHHYAAPGTYPVTLTVTDNQGATGTSTSTVTATAPPNVPPTASFTNTVTNLDVSTNASASADSDGTIASYAWNWGDGNTGTGQTATHSYTSGGTYTVTLTVTDNQGATGTSTASVTVAPAPPANVPPTASFTSTVTNLSVALDASASADSDGTIASYAWDFGDGQTGTGKTVNHTYAAGTYTVTLTVTDNKGATGTSTASVTATTPPNAPPTASFTSSVNGLTASFNGTGSSDSDGTIASYAWDFGDGQTGTGATTSHPYANAGTYTVKLTVTDNLGAANTSTGSVTVSTPVAQPFALDAFGRTVTGGFGTADVGGPWTRWGSASNLSVSGGAGKMLLGTPGTQAGAYLNDVSQTNTDLRMQFSADKAATGGGTYLYTIGRKTAGSNNEYRTSIWWRSNGTVAVSLVAFQGSASGVTLGNTVVIPGTFAPGAQLNVRMQVTGTSPTTIRSKVWLSGASEPANWTVSATDSYAALQAPGGIGVMGYLSGTSTNAPVTVSVQQLSAFAP